MPKAGDKTHPLEDVFNMSDNEDFKDAIFELDIPDNPSQEDIARISLEAYKDIMQDVIHIQPKYRARTLEVANMFLKLAQESITKKSDHQIKSSKLDLDKDKHQHKIGGKKSLDEDKTTTRATVLQELDEIEKSNEA